MLEAKLLLPKNTFYKKKVIFLESNLKKIKIYSFGNSLFNQQSSDKYIDINKI